LCVCDRCLCTLGMCRNVMVVDWGPHDLPVALCRTWVVCAVGGPHDLPVALCRTWVVCALGGPHDLPVALRRTWVVCALGLLRA